MSNLIEEREIFDGIRDELVEHNRLMGTATAHLEGIADLLLRIADSLPIPFVPTKEAERQREESFHRALKHVREYLDSASAPSISTLYDVEAILSLALGNPIWEGRNERFEKEGS
jgi:hypothetical protein